MKNEDYKNWNMFFSEVDNLYFIRCKFINYTT